MKYDDEGNLIDDSNDDDIDLTDDEIEELKKDPKIQKLLEKEVSPLNNEKQNLIKNRNQVLSEKKKLKKELDEIKEQINSDDNDDEDVKSYKKQAEKLQKKIKDYEDRLNTTEKEKNQYVINNELDNQLINLGITDKQARKIAKNAIKSDYNLDVINDEDGVQVTIDNEDVESFCTNWVKTEGHYFVQKNVTSGGGSRGSKNTNNTLNLNPKTMTRTEKAEYRDKYGDAAFVQLMKQNKES